MTSYTKSMGESLAEVRLAKHLTEAQSNVDIIRDIVKKHQNQKVKFKDGLLRVDAFTASAMVQVLDKVNSANKKKIENIINKGSRAAFSQLAGVVMKMDYDPTESMGSQELEEAKAEVRQLKNPSKEMLIKSDDSGVFVIDKKDFPKYQKKGFFAVEETELDEKFTKKDFADNEDNNEHTLNAVELVNMFGDNYEKRQVAQIQKDHDKNRSISSKDQKVRDELVKKYLPKLKEDIDEAAVNVESLPFQTLMDVVKDMIKKLPRSSKKDYEQEVAKILKSMGVKEDLDLTEGKMKELSMYIQQKKKPEWIAKTMGIDVKTVKALMSESMGGVNKMTQPVIVMRHKNNKNLSVSVLPNAKDIKAQEKKGMRIAYALVPTSGGSKEVKDPKGIMKLIKGGDKLNIGEETLIEGTWALPKTPKQKKELKKLLSKPLKAKEATDKLYDLIGDDEMFDDLDDYAEREPNDDVRPMVKSHMKRLGIKENYKEELLPLGEAVAGGAGAALAVGGASVGGYKGVKKLAKRYSKTGRADRKIAKTQKKIDAQDADVARKDKAKDQEARLKAGSAKEHEKQKKDAADAAAQEKADADKAAADTKAHDERDVSADEKSSYEDRVADVDKKIADAKPGSEEHEKLIDQKKKLEKGTQAAKDLDKDMADAAAEDEKITKQKEDDAAADEAEAQQKKDDEAADAQKKADAEAQEKKDKVAANMKAANTSGQQKKKEKKNTNAKTNANHPDFQAQEYVPEGYLELEFKDKRKAEQAYNYINNKIWSGGNPPYEDFNQEGNTLQIDTDGNLNRRNQMLKDLKDELPRDLQFKVAVNEDTLVEAKSGTGYDIYHKDFSTAMQHAYAHAKKKGFVVKPEEIDQKVASGPRKPSKGKTNSYILGTDKRKNVHIQVYGMDSGKYELNMYIESVDLDEDYVLTVKDKEVNRYKSEKDARKAFHDLVQTHGHKLVKVFKEGIDEAVVFDAPTKDGKNTFQVIDRDTKGMRGKQDKFKMVVVDKKGKVIKDWGSHITVDGAVMMAKNKKIIESAASDARRAMLKDKDLGSRGDDPADADDKYNPFEKGSSPGQNIVNQLRKVISLRGIGTYKPTPSEVKKGLSNPKTLGSRWVSFDKGMEQVDLKVAAAVTAKFDKIRRPADKLTFQKKISRSYSDMLKGLQEEVTTETILDRIDRKLIERIKERKHA